MKQIDNNNNTTKEQTDEEQKRIMEHMPYLNLLMEDIREINRALREGKDAVAETKIFMADVPYGWLAPIQPSIDILTKRYDYDVRFCKQYTRKGIQETVKDQWRKNILDCGRNWTLSIKPLVLEVLAEKDILLLTKKMPGGKSFRIEEDGDEND